MDRSPDEVLPLGWSPDEADFERAVAETPFEFVAWIGRGAFARVARVREGTTERALKVGAAAEIAREFEIGQRVRHPHAITGSRLFAADSMAAFSMELFQGADWLGAIRGHLTVSAPRALRRNLPMAFGYEMNDLGENVYAHCGKLGERRIRQILPLLADVLDAVHSAGLVHLDVAPDNLLVRAEEFRLIDFGLATEPAERSARAVGSAGYLAPELGDGRVGVAADWYSLGVCLFEALTGALPFAGGGPEVLVRKQSLSAPRASELCPEVSPDLDALCAALLQRHPRARAGAVEVRASA